MAVPKQKDINHIAKFRRRSCPRRCECACSRRGHGPAVSGILMSTDTVRWRFRRYVSFINQPARNVRDDYSSYGHLTCSYVPRGYTWCYYNDLRNRASRRAGAGAKSCARKETGSDNNNVCDLPSVHAKISQ